MEAGAGTQYPRRGSAGILSSLYDAPGSCVRVLPPRGTRPPFLRRIRGSFPAIVARSSDLVGVSAFPPAPPLERGRHAQRRRHQPRNRSPNHGRRSAPSRQLFILSSSTWRRAAKTYRGAGGRAALGPKRETVFALFLNNYGRGTSSEGPDPPPLVLPRRPGNSPAVSRPPPLILFRIELVIEARRRRRFGGGGAEKG